MCVCIYTYLFIFVCLCVYCSGLCLTLSGNGWENQEVRKLMNQRCPGVPEAADERWGLRKSGFIALNASWSQALSVGVSRYPVYGLIVWEYRTRGVFAHFLPRPATRVLLISRHVEHLLEMVHEVAGSQWASGLIAFNKLLCSIPESIPTFILFLPFKSLLLMHELLLDCSTLTSELMFNFLKKSKHC